eukprot:gene61868-biopygen30867
MQPSSSPSAQPTCQPSLQPATRPSRPTALLLSTSKAPTETAVPLESGTISSKDDLSYFNVGSQLTLTGAIFSHHQCVSNWTIQNSSIDLSRDSLVSGIKVISPMQWTAVTLVLKASVLGSRRRGGPYRFDLRCGRLRASMLVITNMPPVGGRVQVSPPTGFEVQTPFLFTAMNWTDQDLPLRYQFSYDTAQNYRL